jgi:hypothetical protein
MVIILELIFSQIELVSANPGLATDFLYDIALQYYRIGNFEDALHEANKILLIEPNNEEAVGLIEQIKTKQLKSEEIILPVTREEEKKPKIIQKVTQSIIVETKNKPL